MTKTEKLLKLASLSNSERKRRYKQKESLEDVQIRKFDHGTFIYIFHLGQNGSITSKIAQTLTTCDCGHVIVEE